MYDLIETARKASYEFYKSNTNLDYQEIISEAHVAMMEAIRTWDPNKGRNLHSWVAFLVKQNLPKHINQLDNNISFEDVEDTITLQSCDPQNMNPETLMIINETLDAFSQTSKEILRAIFNEEIKPVAYNKNAVTREIKNYLRNKGFPWWKIQAAFKELRQYANSLA